MPLSMTGFGRGVVQGKNKQYVVEARSVNNRYCEIRFHGPKGILSLEQELSTWIRSRFSRGKFDIVLRTERAKKSPSRLLDHEAIVQQWKELDKIRRRLKLKQPIPLELAVNVAKASSEHRVESQALKLFKKAATQALKQLSMFRAREGQNMVGDIRKRVGKLERTVAVIHRRIRGQRISKMKTLKEQVAELLKDQTIDSKRVEVEIAFLLERSDINEEVIRLKSHLQRLKKMITLQKPIGREMDFLIQEMNREINTIGSKAQDIQITNEVLVAKAEIEKIREHAQNLE